MYSGVLLKCMGLLPLAGALTISPPNVLAVPTKAACDSVVVRALTFAPDAQSTAFAFCSSYLHIHPVTVTSSTTVTTTVTTVTPYTTTTETTLTAEVTFQKRAATASLPTPSALAYLLAPAISQACSCISSAIPLATTTTTATSTSDLTATASTVTIVATPTATCALFPLGSSGLASAPIDYNDCKPITIATCPGVPYDITFDYVTSNNDDRYTTNPSVPFLILFGDCFGHNQIWSNGGGGHVFLSKAITNVTQLFFKGGCARGGSGCAWSVTNLIVTANLST